MRGEYSTAKFVGLAGTRFTPTCVGNMLYAEIRCRGLSVHPHMRGEYIAEAIATIYFFRPAVHPHMRGEYS